MPGHRNFKDLRDELAAKVGEERIVAGEQAEIERYDHETKRLGVVRRARALTQTQLAKALGVSQAQVSRIETQSDLYLSTLASYIEAMGGELELVAVFGDERVHLDLADVAPEPAHGDDRDDSLIAAFREPGGRESARHTGEVTYAAALDMSALTDPERTALTRMAEGSTVSELATELGVTEESALVTTLAGMKRLQIAPNLMQINEIGNSLPIFIGGNVLDRVRDANTSAGPRRRRSSS